MHTHTHTHTHTCTHAQTHTVVEQTGIPHPVVSSCPGVEVHAVRAVKHVDAVHGVLGGVTVRVRV
jgi:hypothetical protein